MLADVSHRTKHAVGSSMQVIFDELNSELANKEVYVSNVTE
jgi:hypothetical protein